MRPSVVAVALALIVAAPAARAADPPLDVPSPQLAAAMTCPAAFSHPAHAPVLLVHGTGLTPDQSWSWNYGKVLPQQGYDTCTVALPDSALGDIQVASEYVVYAIERIHAVTGRRVDVIGHSQGGLEPRWAVRWWSGARREVDDLIDLASPNHGIFGADACRDSGNCWPAVWQMGTGAKFMRALNSVSETPGAISYTSIWSLNDELVQPAVPPTARLTGGANTANVQIQDVCPGRPVNHASLLDDAVVYALVIDAMTHSGPADPARVPATDCAQAFMPGVSGQDAASGNYTVYSSGARAFEQHPGVREEPPLKPYARG